MSTYDYPSTVNPTAQPSATLPAGCGAWDVTSYPFGGDFIRPRGDIAVRNVRESHKPGWQLADCEYPGRKGVRAICSNQFQTQDVYVDYDAPQVIG